MPAVHLNFAAGVENGFSGQGASVFPGGCSQDRVDIPSTGSWNANPNATVGVDTKYVEVVTDGKVRVYAGTNDLSASQKQARAHTIASDRVYRVAPGDVVHVWNP